MKCEVLSYSNCPINFPFLCGDGRCSRFEHQCTTSSCPLDKPYLCPDMACVSFIKECKETMAFRPFKTIIMTYFFGSSLSKIGLDRDGIETTPWGAERILFTVKSNYDIFAPPAISINSLVLKAANFTFQRNCTIIISPVSKLAIRNVSNTLFSKSTVAIDRRFQMNNFSVPFSFTVRSAVLNISTTGRYDDNEYFGNAMLVRFGFNPIKLGGANITANEAKVITL